MRIEIDFDGRQSVINALSGLLFDAPKFNEFANDVGSEMVYQTQQNFENQSSPDGVPWQKSLRAIVQSGETLRDTGRLLNSITFNPMPDGVEWGTNVAYAPYLHYGAHIKAKNAEFLRFKTAYGWVSKKEVFVVARPFMGFTQANQQYVINTLNRILSND